MFTIRDFFNHQKKLKLISFATRYLGYKLYMYLKKDNETILLDSW